ncbi:hypothetical protein GWK47_022976 [Chionoecetes opilio]|uniref:Uncharacterized protein n=1 Tax=Chionoecetes opilio TaxID=41210 RepID=A0A8J5BUD8_CHIOP|nr:hypothetical protein GWK47_022976 [Chionoecetes opilio]
MISPALRPSARSNERERRQDDLRTWHGLRRSPQNIVIPGNLLPSRGEVLRLFCSTTRSRRRFFCCTAASTDEKVLKCGDVRTFRRRMCRGEETSKLYEYGALAKSLVTEDKENEEIKESIFRDSLEDMFDHRAFQAMEAKIPKEGQASWRLRGTDRQSARWLAWDEKREGERLRRSDLRDK